MVILTHLVYVNSAYYEQFFFGFNGIMNSFKGGDLFVDESITYVETTKGPEKVDIIYREESMINLLK